MARVDAELVRAARDRGEGEEGVGPALGRRRRSGSWRRRRRGRSRRGAAGPSARPMGTLHDAARGSRAGARRSRRSDGRSGAPRAGAGGARRHRGSSAKTTTPLTSRSRRDVAWRRADARDRARAPRARGARARPRPDRGSSAARPACRPRPSPSRARGRSRDRAGGASRDGHLVRRAHRFASRERAPRPMKTRPSAIALASPGRRARDDRAHGLAVPGAYDPATNRHDVGRASATTRPREPARAARRRRDRRRRAGGRPSGSRA